MHTYHTRKAKSLHSLLQRLRIPHEVMVEGGRISVQLGGLNGREFDPSDYGSPGETGTQPQAVRGRQGSSGKVPTLPPATRC